MGQIKGFVVLAGAALGLSGGAFAQQSADEIRAVVAQVLNDAESRSSLMAGGDAGHDGRFFIAGDGFRLNVGGLLQFRYVANFRDNDDIPNPPGVNDDDFTHGFQTTRTKLDFNGELNKDWFFRVRLSNASERNTYDDYDFAIVNFDYAYAGYKFANGWKATWGQFKLPLLREELVSDAKQLAAERSFVNAMFTQGYSQGVEFAYEAEGWRAFFAFSDGLNSANTDFNTRQSTPGGLGFGISGQADYAFTGRAEFLMSGNWKQFEDFTSPKGSDWGAMVGVAAHWQQSDNTGFVGDTDYTTLRYTFDVSLEGDSWNLYGAFIGDHQASRAMGADGPDVDNFGAIIQGGWRFAENTEVFARWEGLFADEDVITSGEDTFHFITFGFNQYYAGHAAKATLDAVYSLQDTSNLSPVLPNTNVGLLGASDSGEIVVRLQFQVVF